LPVPTRTDEVWKNDWLVKRFLECVRGGIPYANDQIGVMMRLLAASGRPIERFLDLGSGSGLLAIAILAQYPTARASLVDFSAPMMDAARDLLGEDVSLPRFILADLAGPAWVEAVGADAPYDAAVSGFAIHHLADERKRSLFAEIAGLLAPGALFINVEHVASASPWIERFFDELLVDSLTEHQAHAGFAPSRAQVEHDYHRRPDKSANILAPVERQCAWLREAGLVDVDCFFKYFELAVFGGRKPGASS